MPPFRLTDTQLGMLMQAAEPLPADKRHTLLQRVAAHLRLVSHPSDRDIKDALRRGLQGLEQQGRGSAA